MKNNKEETFYDILGLDEKCTPEDIKKAYRKLSFMHHPDKNGNSQESTEKFQKISEAFSILSDPNERIKYDANRNNPYGGWTKNNNTHIWTRGCRRRNE